MDMIEKMGRAMAEAARIDPDIGWRVYTVHARAALAAMNEPTEAMIDRFVSRALCVSIHGDGGWSNYAREQWQTMIAAAGEG